MEDWKSKFTEYKRVTMEMLAQNIFYKSVSLAKHGGVIHGNPTIFYRYPHNKTEIKYRPHFTDKGLEDNEICEQTQINSYRKELLDNRGTT